MRRPKMRRDLLSPILQPAQDTSGELWKNQRADPGRTRSDQPAACDASSFHMRTGRE